MPEIWHCFGENVSLLCHKCVFALPEKCLCFARKVTLDKPIGRRDEAVSDIIIRNNNNNNNDGNMMI